MTHDLLRMIEMDLREVRLFGRRICPTVDDVVLRRPRLDVPGAAPRWGRDVRKIDSHRSPEPRGEIELLWTASRRINGSGADARMAEPALDQIDWHPGAQGADAEGVAQAARARLTPDNACLPHRVLH